MLYSQDRATQRKFLFNAWQKFINKEPLEDLEKKIVEIIDIHKEYQHLINNIELDYPLEQNNINPFLHINLHLTLREQLAINQPFGIKQAYDSLVAKLKDSHLAEHLIMDCIVKMISSVQKTGTTINEKEYFDCIQKKIQNN